MDGMDWIHVDRDSEKLLAFVRVPPISGISLIAEDY
jgi:hypothetical protein